MGITRRLATAAATMLAVSALATAQAGGVSAPLGGPVGDPLAAGSAGPQGRVLQVGGRSLRHECAPATAKQVTCNSLAPVDSAGRAAPAAASPTGWGAADIAAAYKANTDGGAGQTIAVVDAYSDPTIESDL